MEGSTMMIISIKSWTRKGSIALLSMLIYGTTDAQAVKMEVATNRLDYIRAQYQFQTGHGKSEIGAGFLYHLNTTPDDDVFSIYNRDFHAYRFLQHFGVTFNYRYTVFAFKYGKIKFGMDADYFPNLGLKRYSYSGNQLLSNGVVAPALDYFEIKDGGFVLPIMVVTELQAKLTERLDLLVAGGLGTMFNQNFSNEKYTFTIDGQGSVNWQIISSWSIGLNFSFMN